MAEEFFKMVELQVSVVLFLRYSFTLGLFMTFAIPIDDIMIILLTAPQIAPLNVKICAVDL